MAVSDLGGSFSTVFAVPSLSLSLLLERWACERVLQRGTQVK